MDTEVSQLAMLRKIRGNVTQEELAEVLGVSALTVSRWERGDREAKLSPSQTKKLCKFLGITIDELPETFAPLPIHQHSKNPK